MSAGSEVRRAVLLLSGGLDSYTAGAIVRQEGYELHALTIRYGQVHACEVDAARRVATALGARRHVELDVNLAAFGGSSLVGDGDIPRDRALDSAEAIPSTYVPARNTIFLSLALGWAAVLALPELLEQPDLLVAALAGGLLYTVGAILFACGWPGRTARWFGYHECWHAFGIAAGGVFFAMNLGLVAGA